jgi:hypothetical protein
VIYLKPIRRCCVLWIAGVLLVQSRPALGEASISIGGMVAEVSTGAALSGVSVRIRVSPEELEGAARATNTDDSGRFHLDDLPPGRYELRYEKTGFEAQTGAPFGQVVLRLGGGMPMGDLHLQLVQLGSIEGCLYDHFGRPIAGANVQVVTPPRGAPRMAARTGDGGHFSFQLRPGIYLLLVDGQDLRGRDGARRQFNQISSPTFFPGVTDRAQAVRIVLGPGSRLSGTDIWLPDTRDYSIKGTIFGPEGMPAAGVSVRLKYDGVFYLLDDSWEEVRSNTTGVFAFTGVHPGRWSVVAELTRDGRDYKGYFSGVLAASDLENVQIRLMEPFALDGAVQWMDGGAPSTPPENLRVTAVPIDRPEDQMGMALTGGNGQFRMNGLYEGYYKVLAPESSASYYLEAVFMGNHEITDTSAYLSRLSPQVRLVYMAGGGIVRGMVKDGEGAWVALVQDRGQGAGRLAVRYAECADDAGRFELDGLRPGDYYALAVRGLDKGALTDPLLIRDLTRTASMPVIHVGSGSVSVQDLTITPWFKQ